MNHDDTNDEIPGLLAETTSLTPPLALDATDLDVDVEGPMDLALAVLRGASVFAA